MGAVTTFSKKKPTIGAGGDARAEGFENTVRQCATKDEFKQEIGALWASAMDKFLLIGRYLIMAKATLPHGEYQAMVTAELPFSYHIAYQLKTVAENADRISRDRLPRSYSTAFRLVTLTDHELAEAEAKNLVRADVTRREIEAFVQEIRSDRLAQQERLTREYRKLVRRRDSILERMRAIEAELGGPPDSGGVVIDGEVVDADGDAED